MIISAFISPQCTDPWVFQFSCRGCSSHSGHDRAPLGSAGCQPASQPATAWGSRWAPSPCSLGLFGLGVGVGACGEGTGAVVGGCVSGVWCLVGWQVPGGLNSTQSGFQGARQLRCGVGGSWQQLLTKGCHLSFPSFIVAFCFPAVFKQILQVNLKMQAPGSPPPSCSPIHWLYKVLSTLCQAWTRLPH